MLFNESYLFCGFLLVGLRSLKKLWERDVAKMKIHAGDFGKGAGTYMFGSFGFPWQPGDGFGLGKGRHVSELQSVEIATEEAVKRVGGTVGWGVVGATLLGPVGLLAGLVAGGRGKDVTFVAQFKDGHRFLATVDAKTYTKIQAALF